MICLKKGFIYPFHFSKLNWAIAINIIPKGRTMYWLLNIRYDQSMTKICMMAWWDCVTCGTCDESVLYADHMLHLSVCKCVTCGTHVTHVTHECYMRNAQLSFSSGDPLEVTWRASMNSLKMKYFVDDKNMNNDIFWRFIVKNGISGFEIIEIWTCIKFKRLILYWYFTNRKSMVPLLFVSNVLKMFWLKFSALPLEIVLIKKIYCVLF